MYSDALFSEWRGFLFAGDIKAASARRGHLKFVNQILGFSSDQEMMFASLELSTALLEGAVVTQEQLTKLSKDIGKSGKPSLGADVALSQLSLIEVLVRQGQLVEANQRLDQMMSRLKASATPGDPSIDAARRKLADVTMLVGRFGDSRVALQAYREIKEDAAPCQDNLETWLTQADLSLNEGMVKQAEFSMAQAKRCFESKGAVQHFQFARLKNTEGLLHVLMEQPDEALLAFESAERIWQNKLGDRHFWIGYALNNKGVALRINGNLAGARQEFDKSAELWRKALGDGHPILATYLNNIAELEMLQGKLGEAKGLFLNAQKIRMTAFGEEHPWTALVVSNIGEVDRLLGLFDESATLHSKALSIRKRVSGGLHPDTALSHNNLGATFFRQGEFDQARAEFQEALAINHKVLGEAHPRSLAVLASLVAVLVAMEDYPAAEAMLVRLSGIELNRGEPARSSLASILVKLGDVRLKLGMPLDAQSAYIAALDAMNKMEVEERSPEMARNALSGIGKVYIQLGKPRAIPRPESFYPWLKGV